MIENETEQDKLNMCNCLFDAIIEDSDDCVFEEFIDLNKINHRINLRNEIKKEKRYSEFEVLILFNNESIEWEGTTYYRIYKYIFEDGNYAILKPFEEYGIYLYTTGISKLGLKNNFILMVGRSIIKTQSCPIQLNDLADIITNVDEELFVKIPNSLFDEYTSDDYY